MAVETARELKQRLFDAYGGFADKRLRDINRDDPFIVDDRGPGDLDARKQLFLWFCQMFVLVKAVDQVELTLRGGVPRNPQVDRWLVENEANQIAGGITVLIRPNRIDSLKELAGAFETILKRRYDTPAYKHVVPRIADATRRLADVLQAAWT